MIKHKYYYPHGYTILVIPNPNSTYGNTNGSGVYAKNTSIQIEAIPNSGYAFMQWREGESSANPRTILVTNDATYNALFYKLPTGTLRIVDNDLNLYTYSEYDSLISKPAAIGVAIDDGDDWIIYYKDYIGSQGESIKGCKLGTGEGLSNPPFIPMPTSQLLYPHSGLESSNIYKNKYGNGYAALIAGNLSDGNLIWYIPNLYEISQIFKRVADSDINIHDGFDSHFILASCPTITITQNTSSSAHAHWTCDIGFGGGLATVGKILPYRVFYKGNNTFSYMSSGNYTYQSNYNFTRPVSRTPVIKFSISYNGNGNTSGIVPSDSINHYSGDLIPIASNAGDLVKTNYTFAGWNTEIDGTGTDYTPGTSTHIKSNMNLILYAKWV